jgi:hypothetical protein
MHNKKQAAHPDTNATIFSITNCLLIGIDNQENMMVSMFLIKHPNSEKT